jgi:hypothetical protein
MERVNYIASINLITLMVGQRNVETGVNFTL